MTRDYDSEVSPNVVVSSDFCKHEIALMESEVILCELGRIFEPNAVEGPGVPSPDLVKEL